MSNNTRFKTFAKQIARFNAMSEEEKRQYMANAKKLFQNVNQDAFEAPLNDHEADLKLK